MYLCTNLKWISVSLLRGMRRRFRITVWVYAFPRGTRRQRLKEHRDQGEKGAAGGADQLNAVAHAVHRALHA